MVKNKNKLLRNPHIRIFIVLSVVFVVLFLFALLSVLFYNKLFSGNQHFVLGKVIVKSSGYWNGRSGEIMNILKLKPGKTNLYELNLAELKSNLTKHNEFSIENVDVYRVLPDILAFNITERIPRAILYNRKSELLVDGNGVLINKRYCINLDANLPVITGFIIKGVKKNSKNAQENKIPYGKELYQLKPALALISLINTDYPNFNIKVINLYRDTELIVFMRGPFDQKIVRVELPFAYFKDIPLSQIEYKAGVDKLKNKLTKLQQLYFHLRRKQKMCSGINMLYEGRAVVN